MKKNLSSKSHHKGKWYKDFINSFKLVNKSTMKPFNKYISYKQNNSEKNLLGLINKKYNKQFNNINEIYQLKNNKNYLNYKLFLDSKYVKKNLDDNYCFLTSFKWK